jgi:hypothetical protein
MHISKKHLEYYGQSYRYAQLLPIDIKKRFNKQEYQFVSIDEFYLH